MKIFVVMAAIGFFLTGCGAATEGDIQEQLRPVTVTLKDDRSFECIVFEGNSEGGIWCAPPREE